MIKQSSKDAMKRLELEYCPVAVKFCFNKPEGYEELDVSIPLCHHIKNVQTTQQTYYIEAAKEGCVGKFMLGALPFDSCAQAGTLGFHHGIFKQTGCNANIYYNIETFKQGTVNYVLFGPATEVDFDPDIIFFVANVEKADIIMRATSYCTGDLYEQKATNVIGCHWLFNYPYMSGKVNHVITGMHFGMKRAKLYPAGLQIIAIPFQKLQNFFTGLEEMEWVLPIFSDDPEKLEVVEYYYKKIGGAHDPEMAIDPNVRVRHVGQ